MDMIIESYRGNYWLIAFHLLLLGAFIYGCVTIGKHPWPSLCCIFSVVLAYGTFLWWRLALSAVDGGEMVTVIVHVGQALSMLSTILLYLAIFGWRSRPQRAYGPDRAMNLANADRPPSPALSQQLAPARESAVPAIAHPPAEALERDLPLIRAVAKDGAIQGAVGSLAAWGVINLGAWVLLGEENRQFLRGLSDPSGGIYFILYGGLILGSVMMAFAALGFTTRASVVILLDGFSLIGVGVWNVVHDFVAISALKPYGYIVEKPSTIWIVLGICQVIWGVREFACFARMVSWPAAPLGRGELRDAKGHLRSVVARSEDAAGGVVKASITTKGPLGLEMLSKTTQYTGIVLEASAIMISTKLNDCFMIDREPVRTASFTQDGSAKLPVENSTRNVVWNPLSVMILKQWSGQPVEAPDLQRVVTAKGVTLSLLEPYLRADDAQLRAAAVAALPMVESPEAADLAQPLLDDPSAPVVAAALDACGKMNIEAAQSQAVTLLQHEAQEVRLATARYFRAVPSDAARTALETAANSEAVAKVKKEIAKTLKSLRRSR